MSTRQVATTGITLALSFILGALTWQPSFAQRKAEEPAKAEAAGRYQLSLTFGPQHADTVYAMDTATGRVWRFSSDQGWQEQAGPISAPKK